MTQRDAFLISHNCYRLRYILASIRAHPPTKKNCIRGESCIPHFIYHTYLRSLRSDRAGAGQHRLWYSTTLMCRSAKIYPRVPCKILLRKSIRTCRPVHYGVSQNLQAASAVHYSFLLYSYTDPLRAAAATTFVLHERIRGLTCDDTLGCLPSSPYLHIYRYISLVPYLRYIFGCSSILCLQLYFASTVQYI